MNTLLNSLSNFMKTTADETKFHIDITRDEKLDLLSAAPKEQPKIIPIPTIKHDNTTKYRLLRRKDEYVLQKSKIHDGNLIWIDTPTIIEDVKNEMAQ